MTQSILVKCLINRTWNISTQDWNGEWVAGLMVAVSTQSDDKGNLIPVAVVRLNDGTFQSVPMEFIEAEN